MKLIIAGILYILLINEFGQAQWKREDIYTDFVFYNKRLRLEKHLRENIIAKTFSEPLNSDNEHKFESACAAVTQFMFANKDVERGFEKLFDYYDSLHYETKRSFLEAVYGIYPTNYITELEKILDKEKHPKLFSIAAVYLFRNDTSVENINYVRIRMVEHFPTHDSINILVELEKYINRLSSREKIPDIVQLFAHQRTHGQKIIYSFQRRNRDYPGLSIVQNADGNFMRNPNGRLLVFQQLARSASDLPYFITNGSTPQGIYSIQGTAVSRNNYIGPTPNLQLLLPFEDSWSKYFHHIVTDSAENFELDSLFEYKQLFPAGWRNYTPINEAWNAGMIGRTEIIAHGSTIDPEYFKDKPWYPLTPTMGCLCAKELWNITSGRLLVSEQFNLVSTFNATPGQKGFLFVINLDDQQKPVSREEMEWLVGCLKTD